MSDFTDARDAFLKHVNDWFDRLKAKVSVYFNESVDAVEEAIVENDDLIEGDTRTFFEETANDAVAAVDNTPGDWQAKLGAAVAIIAKDFAEKGLKVGTHIIVVLATTAYSKLRAARKLATGSN